MPNSIAHFALPAMRKHNAAASNPHLSSESPEWVSLRRCGWDALMRKPSNTSAGVSNMARCAVPITRKSSFTLIQKQTGGFQFSHARLRLKPNSFENTERASGYAKMAISDHTKNRYKTEHRFGKPMKGDCGFHVLHCAACVSDHTHKKRKPNRKSQAPIISNFALLAIPTHTSQVRVLDEFH